MTARNAHRFNMKEQLTCGLCGRLVRDPRALNCLHSFCLECLRHSLQQTPGSLVCVTCKSTTCLAAGMTASSLPADIFKASLIESQRPVAPCTECDDPAVLYCNDCSKALCQVHVDHHRRRHKTKSHQLVAVSEAKLISSPLVGRPASAHSAESEKETVRTKKRAEKLLKQMTAKLGQTQEDLEAYKTHMSRVRQRSQKISEEIVQYFNELRRALNEREKQLQAELEQLAASKLQALSKQSADVEETLTRITQSLDESVKAVNVGVDEPKLTGLKEQWKKQLADMKDHHADIVSQIDDALEFERDAALPGALAQSGRISNDVGKRAHGNMCHASGAGIEGSIIARLRTSFTITTVNYRGESLKRGGAEVHVQVKHLGKKRHVETFVEDLHNGLYRATYVPTKAGRHRIVVHVEGNSIRDSPFEVNVIEAKSDYSKIASASLKTFSCFGTRPGRLICPIGIAVDLNGCLLVSDANHRVSVFDSDGAFVRLIGGVRGLSDSPVHEPVGIAVNSHGIVAVADKHHCRVQLFDAHGQPLQTFGQRGAAPGQLNGPQGIAIDSLNRMIVADTENHRVQIFSEAGQLVKAIGGPGMADGEFVCPTGVAVDSHDRIIVADNGNSRVQVFGSDGAFVNKFGAAGEADGHFHCPNMFVCVDGNDRVIVSDCGNHRIQIFEQSGQFVAKFGSHGSGPHGQFFYPQGVVVDNTGRIVVVDTLNHQLQLILPN